MLNTKAKPFLKWAGGKTQLLSTINSYLPATFRFTDDITYIEPFIGGGAMLFFMLQHYPNIKRAIINDINPNLINTYKVVRDNPQSLIKQLRELQNLFRKSNEHEAQKKMFLDIRNQFNHSDLDDITRVAYMIFLNRTCFNGLYRVNSKGYYNVPFGRYSNPTICDEELMYADSKILQNVEILNGDFSATAEYICGYTFFYIDPPYRPIGATSSFNSYAKEDFNDDEQIRLRNFYAHLSEMGCFALLSNSDGKSKNPDDCFFDNLYRDFIIERVSAKRSINSIASKRGALSELLIRNYEDFQGYSDVLV